MGIRTHRRRDSPLARYDARPASPFGTAGDWRGEHRDRRGLPHRGTAFAACRYAIERVKQIVPIWKHEHFDGGETWIEGATANPEDEDARAEAEGAHAGDGAAVRAAARSPGRTKWCSTSSRPRRWQRSGASSPAGTRRCSPMPTASRRRAIWSMCDPMPRCPRVTRSRSCHPCPGGATDRGPIR